MKDLKYKNYKELKAAYDSGELSRENKLHLDNDCTFVYVDEECVFRGDGYKDIEELALLCGFPAEWV